MFFKFWNDMYFRVIYWVIHTMYASYPKLDKVWRGVAVAGARDPRVFPGHGSV